jgi:hypothetical protein
MGVGKASFPVPDLDAARRMAGLAAGYKPLPGIPDEFIGAEGRPRAHWLRFLAALMDLGADDIGKRAIQGIPVSRAAGPLSSLVRSLANRRAWTRQRKRGIYQVFTLTWDFSFHSPNGATPVCINL